MATTITYTLPGFVDGQQRTEATSDGQPPENGNLDCVPRAIADGLTFLTGESYNGDELKDAVHGQGWVGFQAARDYVAYCAARGVRLYPVQGTPDALVAHIRSEVAAGHPVVGTIPSLWGLGRDGARAECARRGIPYTTHVVCFCGYGPGALRAANPWIAGWHDGDDTYWANDLEDGEVWVMEKATEAPTHMANTQGLGPGFAAYANAHNADVAVPEQFEQGFSWATLASGAILRYDEQHGVQDDRGAEVLAYVQQRRAQAEKALAAAKAQPAPSPAPTPAPNPGVLLDLPTLTAKAQMWDAAALVFGKLVGK